MDFAEHGPAFLDRWAVRKEDSDSSTASNSKILQEALVPSLLRVELNILHIKLRVLNTTRQQRSMTIIRT
jgi:hypothetical protein